MWSSIAAEKKRSFNHLIKANSKSHSPLSHKERQADLLACPPVKDLHYPTINGLALAKPHLITRVIGFHRQTYSQILRDNDALNPFTDLIKVLSP